MLLVFVEFELFTHESGLLVVLVLENCNLENLENNLEKTVCVY